MIAVVLAAPADIVVIAGDHHAHSARCADRRLRSLATVIGTSDSAT